MTTETQTLHEPDVNHPDRVTLDKVTVLHDYIVVRPLAIPSKKAGSMLHMPETAGERERSHRGIVQAIGPGDWNEQGSAVLPMSVHPGDLVFFGKFAGTEEELDGRTVLVMREQEIRFCVRDQAFRVVLHENQKLDHLIEDYCEVCHGVPAEEAARESLELEREALRLQRAGAELPAVGAVVSAALEQLVDNGVIERRPCAEPGCGLMQTRFNNVWHGGVCGHQHPAIVVTD